MEPISTSLLIAGLVKLAEKAAEGAAGKTGEAAASKALSYWPKVKSLLGLSNDPPADKREDAIGAAVYARAEARPELQRLLGEYEKASVATLTGFDGAVGTSTGDTNADRDAINIQGIHIRFGDNTKIGGG